MNYNESINWLESLPTPEKWTLDSPKKLAQIANVKFDAEIIHIAGTNGKGSVCAFVSSILQAAGFRVGAYTSPHLEKYNERIKINGKDISDAEFALILSNIRPLAERMKKQNTAPSIFEALTVSAFKYFDSKKLDFLVLEAGMGGRLDATNIAPSRIQAITSISFDHTSNLGNTLQKIANEKAGIIKAGSFISTSNTSAEITYALRAKARDLGSKYSGINEDFAFTPVLLDEAGGAFDYSGRVLKLKRLKISLPGSHQFENAALSLSVIENLQKIGYSFDELAIRAGLLKTKWPGRLELISKNPAILLDGAHNSDGMHKLEESLAGIYLRDKKRRLILILGIMADKDYAKMLSIIAPLSDELILTRAAIARSASPEQLESALKKMKLKINPKISPNLVDSIKLAKSSASPGDLICISGSLYTIGEARAYLTGHAEAKGSH